MTGIDLLRMLLDGSFNLVENRIGELSDAEWDGRALDGTSKLGFILWHCARIIDWTAHSAIQGLPEVAERKPWRDLFPAGSCYGAGIPAALADAVSASVPRPHALAYLSEVRAAVVPWFDGQTPETLDAVPALKAHQRRTPGYLDPQVWAEVEDLDGLKAWQLLARPCASHIRVHVGEHDVLLGVLRSKSPSNS